MNVISMGLLSSLEIDNHRTPLSGLIAHEWERNHILSAAHADGYQSDRDGAQVRSYRHRNRRIQRNDSAASSESVAASYVLEVLAKLTRHYVVPELSRGTRGKVEDTVCNYWASIGADHRLIIDHQWPRHVRSCQAASIAPLSFALSDLRSHP